MNAGKTGGGMSHVWVILLIGAAGMGLALAAGGERYVMYILLITILALVYNKFDTIKTQLSNLQRQV